ncbi:hypothetical protein A0X34_01350 [Campylobacter coli]|nr:hypothetical protein [Campylobacter coli]EAJ7402920.1 hypothetical protein [Campylobacter coli]EED2625604.1 EexN family lipoprotein [Campylobacter coli]EGK8154486.1 EexN family lipoprotein [Campylobacter coli]HEA7231938.1 EexN family lipoprotein [Campylobacter coli]
MNKAILLTLIGLFFIACGQTKSVEYYKTHPEEAKKRSDECRLKSIISQDCVNAHSVAIPKEDWDEGHDGTQTK